MPGKGDRDSKRKAEDRQEKVYKLLLLRGILPSGSNEALRASVPQNDPEKMIPLCERTIKNTPEA